MPQRPTPTKPASAAIAQRPARLVGQRFLLHLQWGGIHRFLQAVSESLTPNRCSCRTYVPSMIASLLIPGFELRAALRKQPGLALRPAALAPLPGTEPLLGPVTAAAERRGGRAGVGAGGGAPAAS